MRLIEALDITDAMLADSNITEDDHPQWDMSTSYDPGDKVIVLATHRIYEAQVATTGDDPTEDDGTTWLDIGATERWRAFDQRVGSVAARTSPIYYKLEPGTLAGGVAVLGMQAASVRVRITDTVDGVVYDKTTNLVDNSGVLDWFTYYYDPVNFGQRLALFDLPIYTDSEVEIWVEGSVTVELGQIVIGATRNLGDTLTDSRLGILDFSRKERDAFGNFAVVERAFALTSDYEFSFPSRDSVRVQGILARNRARPTVFSAGEDTDAFGTLVYGFYRDMSINLVSNNVAFATLEVEGIT